MSVPNPQQYGQIRRGRMAADILGEHFTQISNAALRDPRLSFKARGILAWLASHQDGFGCSVAAIVADSDTDGKAAVRSALDELESAGYLSRERVRDQETGRLGPADYLVTDFPMSENLTQALTCGNAAFPQVTPNVRFPSAGKSDTKNTRPKNTNKNSAADFSTSPSPKVTRGSAHDAGVSPIPSENAGPVAPQAAPGGDELTLGQMQEICDAVQEVRGDWYAPGIMAELRKVAHLPFAAVMPAVVEASANRAMTTPGHLADAARTYAVSRMTVEHEAEVRERGREDWRREVHDDVENRARPESRAEHLARLKAEAQAGSLRSSVRGARRAG